MRPCHCRAGRQRGDGVRRRTSRPHLAIWSGTIWKAPTIFFRLAGRSSTFCARQTCVACMPKREGAHSAPSAAAVAPPLPHSVDRCCRAAAAASAPCQTTTTRTQHHCAAYPLRAPQLLHGSGTAGRLRHCPAVCSGSGPPCHLRRQRQRQPLLGCAAGVGAGVCLQHRPRLLCQNGVTLWVAADVCAQPRGRLMMPRTGAWSASQERKGGSAAVCVKSSAKMMMLPSGNRVVCRCMY